MKNIRSIKRAMGDRFTGVLVFTCSDWTEVESVRINEADIAKQNPALYANTSKT